MSKRLSAVNNHSLSKKPRLDIQKNAKPGTSSASSRSSEVAEMWGDDFLLNDNLEMIATQQVYSQDVNTSVSNHPAPAEPSTSTMGYTTSLNAPKTASFQKKLPNAPSTHYKFQPSQKLASSDNIRQLSDEMPSLESFQKDIRAKGNLNSTFQQSQTNGNAVVEPSQAQLSRLEQLEADYAKLRHDFTSKEGETMFLRQQLQQVQQKVEKETLEKTKHFEKQTNDLKNEVHALQREKEAMKTQFDLKHLEITNEIERYKMLEAKTIKLKPPQLNNETKSRSFPSMSRAPKVKTFDCSNQTDLCSDTEYHMNSTGIHCLFNNIPSQIFAASLPEKSVISPEVMAKRDLRNRPVLHDELSGDSENSDLIKPKVTIINQQPLNVEFFHLDMIDLQRMLDTENESVEVIYKINKIVATARELMLNLLSVFEVLITTITNDDIRDMNDVYFSSFYDIQVGRDRSVCDASEWHDLELGLEARRTVGVLSYLAQKSKYLAKYVAGESTLYTDDDKAYQEYSRQMIRYESWTKRGDPYEMLEIFHKFAMAINFARRAHQFTGLICAIMRLLAVVQPQIKLTKKAYQYAANIFKEFVFARPLLVGLEFIAEMAAQFTSGQVFADCIVECPNQSALNTWKNDWTFTNDACIMVIYITQLKRFPLDDITVINITHALTSVADNFSKGIVPWPTKSSSTSYSTTILITFIVTMLSRSASIDLSQARKLLQVDGSRGNGFCDHFWHGIQVKQYHLIQRGLHFLAYVVKRDPEFINDSDIVDNSVSLFIEHVKSVQGLNLNEIEEERLILIRSFTESALPAVACEPQHPKSVKTANSMQKKQETFLSNTKSYTFKKSTDENQQMIDMFKSVLHLKNSVF